MIYWIMGGELGVEACADLFSAVTSLEITEDSYRRFLTVHFDRDRQR